MANFQIGVQLPGLPIVLQCISDASVALTPQQKFKTVYECSGGFESIFDNEGFTINGESFNYNEKIWYKQSPNMLQWLKQNNMIMPNINN